MGGERGREVGEEEWGKEEEGEGVDVEEWEGRRGRGREE